MNDWRTHAEAENWGKIDPWRLKKQEKRELLGVLAAIVPRTEKGDGLETFIDFIAPSEARSRTEAEAAELLESILQLEPREPLGQVFSQAIADAARTLEEELEIHFESLRDTYVFRNTEGELCQLPSSVGSSLCERDNRWLMEQVDCPNMEAFHRIQRLRTLYPWRQCKSLWHLWRFEHFPVNSSLHHALAVLASHDTFKEVFQEHRNLRSPGSQGRLGSRGNKAVDAMSFAHLGYLVGRSHEALLKKKHERDAIRGKKNLKAARQGGEMREARNAPLRKIRVERMNELVPIFGVDKAAARCECEGLGGWQAIKKQWYRWK